MLERYKTLGAMLALGEFSVSELAALSGVRESSVRTIMRREKGYVEQIGTQPSGRRGGQPGRWRLRPEARERLRSELLELERLGVGPWIGERQDDSNAVPAGIIAAEDALLRLAPAAADPVERAEFVKLAQAQLDAAVAIVGLTAGSAEAHVADRPADYHRRIVELLIDLEQAEQLAVRSRHSQVTSAGLGIVMDLLLAAGRVEGRPLADAVKSRLQRSPVPWFGRPATAQGPPIPSPCLAVGIELLPYQLVGALVDERGERLACEHMVLEDMDVKTVISGAASLADTLVKAIPDEETTSERIVLGFQLGGPVEAETGTVLFYRKAPPKPPSTVRGIWWPDRQPLGRLLEEATGLPAVVENDANAFATYQQWFGVGREVSRFAVVLIREGVGGSLVIGSRLFDGPMELGNLSVLPGKSERTCDCGSVGCLETTGGIYGILEAVYDYSGESPDNVAAAAELAEHLDINSADGPFGQAGEANAKGIGIIVNFARPQRVVLYAPSVMTDPAHAAARAFRAEVDTFRSYCHNTVLGDCELIIKPLRPYDGAHGAALLALERRFGITANLALVDA
jgi:predicted NBD/HSP70 family sugar kinase